MKILIKVNIGLVIMFFALFALPGGAVENDIARTENRAFRPGEIKFSPEYGRITEVFDGGSEKLVIHIQDAHTNYEAQLNAARILEELINKYGLYLILVEGGSRDVSLNHYRENSTLEARKEMAERALKEGVIAGEEYLNIVSGYPMKLQGIENRSLYDQNMMAFFGVDKGKNDAFAYTRLLSSVVANLKARVYNKELKEIDAKRIGFKEEKVGLVDYVVYLDKLASEQSAYGSPKKLWFNSLLERVRLWLAKRGLLKYAPKEGIDLSNFRNYKNLLDSIGLEKEIDFPTVERERAEVIDILSKKISQDELNELLTKSVDFKAGKLTQVEYHAYLEKTMKNAKIDKKNYPNLERYIRYITIYEDIDSANLFKELKIIENKIEQPFIINDDQRQLLRIAKDLELLVEFINLKLSPDDFEYYQKNEGNFNIEAWVRFLKSLAAKYKIKENIPQDTKAVENILPSVKDFYIIAKKRDEVFLNNTKKYMDEEGVNIAVLIAGGFHTPTLMQLFKENKISYVVVSPKVLKPTDEKLYHKILTEGWAPAEETAPAETKELE